MNKDQIIQNTILFVKESLKNTEAGHDWFHIERVYKNAKQLLKTEDADTFTVVIGALLHDIADAKFHGGDESIGPLKAREFLEEQSMEETFIQHIENIIRYVSFKNTKDISNRDRFHSKELEIIQDADRLDAMGAIGIARAFQYGGFKNRLIYDSKTPPNLNQSKEEYKKSKSPTINHFYEKLLLLKDLMNTSSGKKMAIERHKFMEIFLEQFYTEI